MKVLGAHEIDDLRRIADDAQVAGRFDDAETLRLLLDEHAIVQQALYEMETDDVERIIEVAKIESETAGNLNDALDELDSARADLKSEAENLEDVQISIDHEIDKLEELKSEALKSDAPARRDLEDAIANLKDVVLTIRGQRDRLKRSADTAARALKEAGR